MSWGIVAPTMISLVEKASLIAAVGKDRRAADELDWLTGVLRTMHTHNNYQFFRRIAKRKDAVQLIRWCMCLLKDSPDRDWIIHEAEKVYGAGVPPFQPTLLEIVRKFSDSYK